MASEVDNNVEDPTRPAQLRATAALFWGAVADDGERSPRDVAAAASEQLAALRRGDLRHPTTGEALDPQRLMRECIGPDDGGYLAPEMARGEAFDERALVFSVGVLIFERLTAHHPFGSVPDVRMARLRRGELGSGVNYFPSVPSELRAILLRAMGPFPEARYASLDQLQADLERFAQRDEPAAGPPAAVRPSGVRAPVGGAANPAAVRHRVTGTMRRVTGPSPRTLDVSIPPVVAESTEQAVLRQPSLSSEASPVASPTKSLPRWLIPLLFFLGGVLVATVALTLVTSRGKSSTAVRSEPRRVASTPEPKRDSRKPVQLAAAGHRAPAVSSADASAVDSPSPPAASRKAETDVSSDTRVSPSASESSSAGMSEDQRAARALEVGQHVAKMLRRCGVHASGASLRVAVYAHRSGHVIRSFARGAEITPAVLRCMRRGLRRHDLGLTLPQDDFIEWQLRPLKGRAAVRLIRPVDLVRRLNRHGTSGRHVQRP